MEQFKRAKVIMLSTKISMIGLNHKQLVYSNGYKTGFGSKSTFTKDIIPQHLYIISDDEKKEGDWTLCLDEIDSKVMNWNINQCIFKHSKGGNCTQCKKIIATTNNSLEVKNELWSAYQGKYEADKLPQPSQQFIEKYIESYNKGEVITDVLVEYEDYEECWKFIGYNEDGSSKHPVTNRLKINPKDNTITIKKLKDSWNREEVIELIKEWRKVSGENRILTKNTFDNWIKYYL